MSQREKFGFKRNAPVLAVEAEVPISACPTRWPKGIPVSCGLGGFTPRASSVLVGVGHPDNITACSFRGRALRSIVSCEARPSRQSLAEGVAQPASCAKSRRSFACGPKARALAFSGSEYSPPALNFEVGVGHPEQPLSDMRRADARSAQIGGPDTISQCFQVSAYSGEPFTASLARNLFSKDDWRAADFDEAAELRPEVAFVRFSPSCPGAAERLAGA